ncbi:MAG: cupin domain-containing protein [Pseudonocardiaceae bacterium]
MKIVVIGGSGLIGSKLVTRLGEHGHEAVSASPSTGVNTLTGEGLAEALTGASVVIDVSNSPSWEDAAVLEFFQTSTHNLLAAEAAAGVGHHVALSVVGTDQLAKSGYFRAKIAQEKLIENSSIPYSIVHATQFFEFVKSIAAEATDGDTVRLPPVLIQPIAADDVAKAIGRISVGSPVNGITEVAGPEQFRLDELIRQDLAVRNDPRTVLTDPHARYFGIDGVSERTLIPGDGAVIGDIRFSDWLSQSGRDSAMTDTLPAAETRSTAWQTALTMLQKATPPFIPDGADVMTVVIEFPPGDPGTPPHRHSGPAFGYMLEGEMLFELEGEPPRVIRAGEAFWEPGGDVIHYQDGNNRADVRSRFVVTMMGVPGQPMLTLVGDEELALRKDRRAPPSS